MRSTARRRRRFGHHGPIGHAALRRDTTIFSPIAEAITFPDADLTTVVSVAPGADPNADPNTYAWQPIPSNYVYWSVGITIRRGLEDGQTGATPAQLSMRLKNAAGRYAWGRGTPIRIDLNAGGSNHERFMGWVSSKSPRADPSGNERYLPLTAAGVLQRVGQGRSKPAVSCLRTLYTAALDILSGGVDTPPIVAYWSLEDLTGARFAASGLAGKPNMIRMADPVFGANTDAIGSLPLPTLGINGGLVGNVAAYTADPNDTFGWSFVFKASGDCRLLQFETDQHRTFTVDLLAGDIVLGELTAGSLVTIAGPWDDSVYHGMDYKVQGFLGDVLVSSNVDTTGFGAGSIPGAGIAGVSTRMWLNPTTDINAISIGHVGLLVGTSMGGGVKGYLDGLPDEGARERWIRVCTANGVPFGFSDDYQSINGSHSGFAPDQDTIHIEDSTSMGAQRTATLETLLGDIARAEVGQVAESLDGHLWLRLHNEFERRAVDLTIDIAAGQVIPPFDPTDDDQRQRNDITVNTSDGDSGRDVEIYGPLGTTRSGTYDDAPTVNLGGFFWAAGNDASYQVMLGTNIELRYPRLTIYLHKNPELIAQWLGMRDPIGCRAQVTNPHPTISLDTLDQTIIGYTEYWDQKQWIITLVLVPYIYIYEIGSTDGNLGRLDNPGSTLVAALDSTTATFQVASPGAVWSTTASGYMIGIEGQPYEPVRVLSVAGSTSPQTFTVTRHAQGVAHLAGAQVRLWRAGTIALRNRTNLTNLGG